MSRKYPTFSLILLTAPGLAAAIAVLACSRGDGAQANAEPPTAPACSSAIARPEAVSADSTSLVLRLDYAGAEALIAALERDSLSDSDIDALLRFQGVCAMVDNVSRFIPGVGVSEFRKEIRHFVEKKKGGDYDPYFRLRRVWQARADIRALVAKTRADEQRILREALAQLEGYQPNTGTVPPITAYFVAGGVSTGFVFDDDPSAFYANLADAQGNANDVTSNIAHEAYRAMQNIAEERAGLLRQWGSVEKLPPVERLLRTVLMEGTAKYVVERQARRERIADDFARFDTVLKQLEAGTMSWEKAYDIGFTSNNDDSFYFVGHEMAKAIDQHCGPQCIREAFGLPAIEFFRRYIELYRKHPDIRGRFSPETERLIAG